MSSATVAVAPFCTRDQQIQLFPKQILNKKRPTSTDKQQHAAVVGDGPGRAAAWNMYIFQGVRTNYIHTEQRAKPFQQTFAMPQIVAPLACVPEDMRKA